MLKIRFPHVSVCSLNAFRFCQLYFETFKFTSKRLVPRSLDESYVFYSVKVCLFVSFRRQVAEESIFVRRAMFQQPRRISRPPYISLSRLIFSESPSPSSPTPPDVLYDSSLIGHFPPHLLDSRALENQLFLKIIRPCVVYQVFTDMREDFILSLFAYLDIFPCYVPTCCLKINIIKCSNNAPINKLLSKLQFYVCL